MQNHSANQASWSIKVVVKARRVVMTVMQTIHGIVSNRAGECHFFHENNTTMETMHKFIGLYINEIKISPNFSPSSIGNRKM